MWNSVLRPVFKFMVDSFLGVAGSIVHGAAYAFGWVKGLGPKLKEAAKAFDGFRDQVNRALAQTDNSYTLTAHMKGAQAVINSLTSTANLLDYIRGNARVDIGVSGRGEAGGFDFPRRAFGGNVIKDHPYVVGEKRAELFWPGQNGTILPRVPATLGANSGGGNTYILNTYNPLPERESESVPKTLRRAANRFTPAGSW